MTDFEFAACVDGYNQSQGGESELEPPTAEEFDLMVERTAWAALN